MDDPGTGESNVPRRPPVDWAPPPEPPTGAAPANWPPPDLPIGPDSPELLPTPARRILHGTAWVVGLFCLLFLGRALPILTGARTATPYAAGQVFGTILAAVLVGLFIRWVVVKVRRRGRLLSPWILVVAILVLLLGMGRQP